MLRTLVSQSLLAGFVLCLLPVLSAQEKQFVAFPERDTLSPFRSPAEVYAPPDKLYSLLRRMRNMASDPALPKSFDESGRELVDSDHWRNLRKEAQNVGLDAGYLASIMRMSKNDDDRRTAFYAAFYCDRTDYVFNLISHIPGEPIRATRQEALPRAIRYLQANINKRFGDLEAAHKKEILAALPEPGSPAAKAAGMKRYPIDSDHLHDNDLRPKPFFQMLDLDEPIDQAQGLWFLKEVFTMRRDLAEAWLEPALPRIRQLLQSDDTKLREQVIGLLHAIAPKDLRLAKVDEEPAALREWADQAIKAMFPPIRNLNNTIIQLFPSPERDAVAAAAQKALETSAIGEPSHGKTKDGQAYRGFRIAHVPEPLAPLAIPKGAVVITINGVAVNDAASVLSTAKSLIDTLAHPRVLFVEYVLDGASHAVEYRIL